MRRKSLRVQEESIRETYKADAVKPEIRVSVETLPQLKTVLSVPEIALVYADEGSFTEKELADAFRMIRAAGKKAGRRLRRIMRDTDPEKENTGMLPDAVLYRAFEEIGSAENSENLQEDGTGIERIFDYTVYGYNAAAALVLQSLGADTLTFPIELNERELKLFRREAAGNGVHTRFELLVYGYLPMMVSANCLAATTAGCDHKNRVLQLTDRTGKDMHVRCYCRYCYNQIYNADALVLYDLPEAVSALRPDSIRYDFTIEGPEEVRRILAGEVPRNMTRGHFRRGVL